MSIIQRIREKGALISAIVIALALLGFILMDAFAGRTGSFGQPSNYIGKVNGEKIDRMAFERKIKETENRYLAQGMSLDDNTRQSIMEQTWDQEVNQILLEDEYEKLGLEVTDKELRGFLLANPPADIKQQFTDQNGNFNPTTAQQQFNNVVLKDPNQKEQARNYFLMQKYLALLTASIHVPKWFLEKRNADNSLISKFSYINVPYTSIPDSTVKVTDEEIREYMEAHKKDFEQKEETRSISFVMFSAAPSSADSAAARNSLAELKDDFRAAKNPGEFIQRHGSAFPFLDTYLSRNAIQQTNKDSILAQPVGEVYGPYLDVNNNSGKGLYVMSKIIDVKQWPDTVKVRHILVSTAQQDPQTGRLFRTRDDSTAKRLIDSIQGLLNQGQSFDSLVVKFSEDPGSKNTGGVYDNLTANGQMVPEFTEFAFGKRVGERGIVKTTFGYHLMEVLSQKGSSPAYKIAYLTKEILASPETDQDAHNQANLFMGDSPDLEAFNANYDKNLRPKGIQKLVAPDIRPLDYQINGLPAGARSFVKKIFEADKGDVLEPERVGDYYVVAAVTEINEPGLASVSAARMYVEPILRNKKKAQQIIRNIGQITSLEQVASKTNRPVEVADSVRFNGGPMGYEPRVIGASFNPANNGKLVTEAIEGQSGVFVIRVESQGTVPVDAANVDQQKNMMEMQAKQMMMSQIQQNYVPFIETLKRSAKIKDNRAEFY